MTWASTTKALAREVLPFKARVLLRQLPAIARSPFARRLPRGSSSEFAHVQCSRETPLRREKTTYAESLQRAKEQNVARAAELIHRTVISPGETFSWHATVGPPLRLRGFVEGPELHEGELAPGVGGGLCQVANLLYWLALHAGLEVTERHRHHLDLFPDDHRTAPFGCGATVYFPLRDLKIRSALGEPVMFELGLCEGALVGAVRTRKPLGFQVELVERDHRFVRRDGAVFRENTLFRRLRFASGEERIEWLCRNTAQVTYEVPDALITEGTER